jgi:hypothetical protein
LTTGDWYRYSIAIGESLSGNRSITMALRNLTNGADVDLNGAGSGNTITFSVTDAQFGIAPENAVGGVVRVSGNGNAAAIDNVTFTAVPEPTTIATLGAAVSLLGLHIARRRRMWSFKTNVSPND